MSFEDLSSRSSTANAGSSIFSFLPAIEDKEEAIELLQTFKSKKHLPSDSIDALKWQGYLEEISQFQYYESGRTARKISDLEASIEREEKLVAFAQEFVDRTTVERHFMGSFGRWVSELFEPAYQKQRRQEELRNAQDQISKGNEKIQSLIEEQESKKLHYRDYSDVVTIGGSYFAMTESARELLKAKEDRDAFSELASNYQMLIDSKDYDELIQMFCRENAEELQVAVIKTLGTHNTLEATNALTDLFFETRSESQQSLILNMLAEEGRPGGIGGLVQCMEESDDIAALPTSLVKILITKIPETDSVRSMLSLYYNETCEDDDPEAVLLRKMIATGLALEKTPRAKDELLEFFAVEGLQAMEEHLIDLMKDFHGPEAAEGLNGMYREYTDYDVPLSLVKEMGVRVHNQLIWDSVDDLYLYTEDDQMRDLLVTSVKTSATDEASELLASFLESDCNKERDFPEGLLETVFERRANEEVKDMIVQEFDGFSLDEMQQFAELCINEDTEETHELFADCLSNASDDEDLLIRLYPIRSDAATRLFVKAATHTYELEVPASLSKELVGRLQTGEVEDTIVDIYGNLYDTEERHSLIDELQQSQSPAKKSVLSRLLQIENAEFDDEELIRKIKRSLR